MEAVVQFAMPIETYRDLHTWQACITAVEQVYLVTRQIPHRRTVRLDVPGTARCRVDVVKRRRRLMQTQPPSPELLRRLQPQHHPVGGVAAKAAFRRDVDVAVRALLHIADADVERREQRLTPLGLRRLIE